MACHYHREPEAGILIGCCNDGLAKIPSERHENCMCRSATGIYAGFCPIYAKFRKKELNRHKGGILRRIILNSYRRYDRYSEIVPESMVAENIYDSSYAAFIDSIISGI